GVAVKSQAGGAVWSKVDVQPVLAEHRGGTGMAVLLMFLDTAVRLTEDFDVPEDLPLRGIDAQRPQRLRPVLPFLERNGGREVDTAFPDCRGRPGKAGQ